MFNLNDDESGGLGFGDDDADEGSRIGSAKLGFTLTHGGRSIDELKGDDFVAQGLGDDDDDEDDLEDDFGINRTVEGEEGAVERDPTRRNNFGGFGDDAGDEDVSGSVASRAATADVAGREDFEYSSYGVVSSPLVSSLIVNGPRTRSCPRSLPRASLTR